MGFESNYGSTRIAAPNLSALNVLTGLMGSFAPARVIAR
jgi:hypothetical protein